MRTLIGFKRVVFAAVAAMGAVVFGADGIGATNGKIQAVNWIADGSGNRQLMGQAYRIGDGSTGEFVEYSGAHYVFDFGTARKISAVKVWPRPSFGDRAKPFKVRGSNDNQTWTELYANATDFDGSNPLEVALEIAERYRYIDFYNFTSGNMSELAVYSDELMLDMGAADPWQKTATDAADSADGVKIAGTLLNPAAEGAVTVEAFAAREDFGYDYDAWVNGGATKITLEPGENNAYAGFFTGLDEGRWYWRAFAVHGTAKVPCGTTWPFAVDTLVVHPVCHYNNTGIAHKYDGSTSYVSDSSGTMIFDLSDTYESTKGYHLESIRVFLRDPNTISFFNEYTAMQFDLGYESEGSTINWYEGASTTDASGKRTLKLYQAEPTGIDWSNGAAYPILASPFQKLPLTVVFPVDTTTRKPRCVRLPSAGIHRTVEFEFRMAKDPAAEVTLEVAGEPNKFGVPEPAYGEYGLKAGVEQVATVEVTKGRTADKAHDYELVGWRLTTVNGDMTNVTESTSETFNRCAFTPAAGDNVKLEWLWQSVKAPTRIPATYAVYSGATLSNVSQTWLLFDNDVTSTSVNGGAPAAVYGKNTVVLDFGALRQVDEVGVAPRTGGDFAGRLVGLKVAGSVDGANWDEPFFTIAEAPDYGVLTRYAVTPAKRYRYLKFYDYEDIHEIHAFSKDLMVETMPADPWGVNAVDAADSANGVKITAVLANGNEKPAQLVAFAAKVDFGEDYDAWEKGGVKLDLGTAIEAQATPPSGYFTGLKRGRWYWRAFALQDGVPGVSDRTWPFTVGTQAIHPKCYSNGTVHYDGVVGWTNDDGNDYVFDLRSIPSGWHLDSVRLWKRDGFYRRLVSHELTLGYATGDEEVSFNGTGVIKSAEGAVRVIEGFGGLAGMTGVEWRPGEPLLLSAPYDKAPTVYSFPVAKPSAAKPVALKFAGIVGGDYNSLGEIELRIARDEVKGLMILIQ